MLLGLYTDSLRHLKFDQALAWAASEGAGAVEIGTGNFSSSPHCDLASLKEDPAARRAFLNGLSQHSLTLSALNCSGNLLDPEESRRARAQAVFRDTVVAASRLGIDTVVTMSGCPGDLGGGAYPNWVTCTWQREYVELLERQWDEVILPFWREQAGFLDDHGVRIAIEMHPGQSVYNPRTLLRLREAVGDGLIGANLDPSHLFFQNMDPLVVLKALGGDAIFHVHAKDTRIHAAEMALNGSLDTRPMGAPGQRSWEYVTLGFGHDALFWRQFVATLASLGYDGVLSVEHEDPLMSAEEGIRKSFEFLGPILVRSEAKIPAQRKHEG